VSGGVPYEHRRWPRALNLQRPTRNQISEDRKRKSEVGIRKSERLVNRCQKTEKGSGKTNTMQRYLPPSTFALYPRPIITYHSFSPSQLLTFPPSWLVPQPATRTLHPAPRIPQPAPRLPHHVLPENGKNDIRDHAATFNERHDPGSAHYSGAECASLP
jgi:hypothetical protein